MTKENRTIDNHKLLFVYIVIYSVVYFIINYKVGLYYEVPEILFAYFIRRFAFLDISLPIITNDNFLMLGILKSLYTQFPDIEWCAVNRIIRNVIGFAVINFLVSINTRPFTKILLIILLIGFFFDSIFFIENVRNAGILSIAIGLMVTKGRKAFSKKYYYLYLFILIVLVLTARVEAPFVFISLYFILDSIFYRHINYRLLRINMLFLIFAIFYHGLNAFTNIERTEKSFIYEKLIDDTSYLSSYKSSINLSKEDSVLLDAVERNIYDRYENKFSIPKVMSQYSLSYFLIQNISLILNKYFKALIFYFQYSPFLVLACILSMLFLLFNGKIFIFRLISLLVAFFVFSLSLSLITYIELRVFTPVFLILFIILIERLRLLHQAHSYLLIITILGLLNLVFLQNKELAKEKNKYVNYSTFLDFYKICKQNNANIYFGEIYQEILPNKAFDKQIVLNTKFIDYGVFNYEYPFLMDYQRTFGNDWRKLDKRILQVIQNNGVIVMNDNLKTFYEEYLQLIKGINISFDQVTCLSSHDFCLYKPKVQSKYPK